MIDQPSKNPELTFDQLQAIDVVEKKLAVLNNEIDVATKNLRVINLDISKALKEREYQERLVAEVTQQASEKSAYLKDLEDEVIRLGDQGRTLHTTLVEIEEKMVAREKAIAKKEEELAAREDELSVQENVLISKQEVLEKQRDEHSQKVAKLSKVLGEL